MLIEKQWKGFWPFTVEGLEGQVARIEERPNLAEWPRMASDSAMGYVEVAWAWPLDGNSSACISWDLQGVIHDTWLRAHREALAWIMVASDLAARKVPGVPRLVAPALALEMVAGMSRHIRARDGEDEGSKRLNKMSEALAAVAEQGAQALASDCKGMGIRL